MKIIPNPIYFDEIREILSKGENVELFVKGTSMRPFLRSEKDKVILSPFSPDCLQKGLLVLFFYKDRYILHRIIQIQDDLIYIQGDGVCGNYETAVSSDIIGYVKLIIRPNGKTEDPYALKGKVYWRIWYFLRPVRRYLLAIYNRVIS